jgi:CDP-glucose 4,6-dehydratase
MSDYWRNKKVLITGINGFVGGNLAKSLIEHGAEVFGLVRNENKGTFLYHEKLDAKIRLFSGDLCDKELFGRIISEEQINSIFHLAAQVEVGVGMSNPFLTFETNVRGTYSLLEACRLFPSTLESIVIASSDKAYGSYPVERMPYKEDYPLLPQYPYDTSKACGDLIAQSYANDVYNLPIIVTRFCNIYGPGQLNFSAVVPDGFRSALGYSKFIPRSDGSMTRDFLHVDDVSDLYLTMGEGLAKNPTIAGEIFNAGPNEPVSVKDVLKLIFSLANNQKDFDEISKLMENKKTTGEIDYQSMDFDKVHKHFGWAPKIGLEDGLKITLDWFADYLSKQKV